MRAILCALVIGGFIGSSGHAQEKVTLTAPILAKSGIAEMRPASLYLDRQHGVIQVVVKEWVSGAFVEDGRSVSVRYDAAGSTCSCGTTTAAANIGMTLIVALNKANLSTTTLEKRVMQQLIADGHLAGSVSGTPE